jgi:primosomal replication protein N
MRQESILENNSIRVSGMIESDFKFSHEVYGEGFYNFNLSTPRLSSSFDTLPIVISERLADQNLLTTGTSVNIVGQVRSYNNNEIESKKNKLLLSVFTRDIEIVQSSPAKTLNEVYLNGFVCKTPIYRTTPFGREISDLLIAVNRSYNKSDYIPCIAWGRNARFSGKLNIGDNIKIWGRMQSRSYQKKYDNGEIIDKVAYEVSISKIENSDTV